MSPEQVPSGISPEEWATTPPSVQALVASLETDAKRFEWVKELAQVGDDPRVRVVLLTLYYLAIIIGLIVLYGRGDFSTPPFIYQGF